MIRAEVADVGGPFLGREVAAGDLAGGGDPVGRVEVDQRTTGLSEIGRGGDRHFEAITAQMRGEWLPNLDRVAEADPSSDVVERNGLIIRCADEQIAVRGEDEALDEPAGTG